MLVLKHIGSGLTSSPLGQVGFGTPLEIEGLYRCALGGRGAF